MSENAARILVGVASALIMFIITKIWDRWQNSIRYLEYLVGQGTDGSVKLSIYNRTGKDYSDVELDVYFKDKTDTTREVRPVSYKVSDDLRIVDGAKSAASQGNSRLELFLKVINRNGVKPFLSVAFTVEGAENIDCFLNVIKLGVSTRRVEPNELAPIEKKIMASEAVTVGIAMMIGLSVFMYSPESLPPITKSDPPPVQMVDTTKNQEKKDGLIQWQEIEDKECNPVATYELAKSYNSIGMTYTDSGSIYRARIYRDAIEILGMYSIDFYDRSQMSVPKDSIGKKPVFKINPRQLMNQMFALSYSNGSPEFYESALLSQSHYSNLRNVYPNPNSFDFSSHGEFMALTERSTSNDLSFLSEQRRYFYFETHRADLMRFCQSHSSAKWNRVDTIQFDSVMRIWIKRGD